MNIEAKRDGLGALYSAAMQTENPTSMNPKGMKGYGLAMKGRSSSGYPKIVRLRDNKSPVGDL